jgi:hypothetical protein
MGHEDTHKQLHELFDQRRFDEFDQYVAEPFAYIDHPRRLTLHTLDEFKAWLREWTTAFSNAQLLGASYVGGANFSVAYFHGRGENDGPLGSLGATGHAMDMPFCETLRYDPDGKIIGGEVYYDRLTMLVQLGHIEQSAMTGMM